MSRAARILRERRTIAAMIAMRCREVHAPGRPGLCDDCERLLAYAGERIDHCVFKDAKPVCARCPVHCYGRSKREEIRAVMRFSGPRMLLSHPVLAIQHLLDHLRFPPREAAGR